MFNASIFSTLTFDRNVKDYTPTMLTIHGQHEVCGCHRREGWGADKRIVARLLFDSRRFPTCLLQYQLLVII